MVLGAGEDEVVVVVVVVEEPGAVVANGPGRKDGSEGITFRGHFSLETGWGDGRGGGGDNIEDSWRRGLGN